MQAYYKWLDCLSYEVRANYVKNISDSGPDQQNLICKLCESDVHHDQASKQGLFSSIESC